MAQLMILIALLVTFAVIINGEEDLQTEEVPGECIVNYHCNKNQACVNEKCVDPCLDACAMNTSCVVKNHFAVCSCLDGYRGDPFVSCEIIPYPAGNNSTEETDGS